jgi:NDP-sugar pyrophosphorylase family protein
LKAIILAGGRGSRLYPYTEVFPKPLVPLDNMAILHIVLLQLYNAGFSQITLCVGYKAHLIEEYFGNGEWLGLDIKYVWETKRLGTAGPLSLVSHFDEPTLVMNADLLTTVDFADVFAAHQRGEAIATVVLCRYTLNIDFGVVNVDHRQRIVGYLEKPNLNYLISSGIYVFEPTILDYIPDEAYMDMPALLQSVMADGHKVNSYLFEGDWFDIGTPKELERAEKAFRHHRSHYLKRNGIELIQPQKMQEADTLLAMGG